MTEPSTPEPDRVGLVPWPPLLMVVLALLAWGLTIVVPLPWPGERDTAARVVGIGFGVAGLALAIWAAQTLSRHKTTILPNGTSDALVTDGPYRFRRNPIYVADVLLLLAAADLAGSVWFIAAALVFAGLVTWLQILPEERHLEARFGDAYRAYKAQTRRWL